MSDLISTTHIIEESIKQIHLFSIDFEPSSGLTVFVHYWIIIFLIFVTIILLLAHFRGLPSLSRALDIDSAEIGVGSGKLTLRPNLTDRQVAYAVWVELSTRKIGLKIDLDHDVISEIYDSWYEFFAVTRELIKTIPVNRVTDQTTRKIINLSIGVLNEGLRPHLTRWQARFRRWYDKTLEKVESLDEAPQNVQLRYPEYNELTTDMLAVNRKLIAYRAAMEKLVHGNK